MLYLFTTKMKIKFLTISLAILLANLIIILLNLVLFIVNTSTSSPYIVPSEKIDILHQSNTGAVKFKISLINHLGSVAIVYDYNSASERFYLDFEIVTNKKPFNLLDVSLNDVVIKPEVLLASNSKLRFEEGQYVLNFDDSIEKTGFFVDLDLRNEYLNLAEIARISGINFRVKCIERETGVLRNVLFKLSVEKGKKFFDLIERYNNNIGKVS
ncbi:hypothetical protein QIA04_04870 (plasmid) [Borreliella burgdorferi]|nr:hypothetical protein [Borreliella burgdorferi]ACN24229.1 conserved hypothetical protein [Borreliella burgdorferi 64b]MCR8876489.1 hypothetical protein [Borreliella burgdorferi]